MTNPWLAHVRKTMVQHPGQSFNVILKRANRTYNKGKKGGNKKGKKMKKKQNKSTKIKKRKKTKN